MTPGEQAEPASPGSRLGGTFACVVDSHPRFHLEALRWYATLHRAAGVDPSDLVVHSIGETRSEVLDYLSGQGVSVVEIEPFDSRSPHCNKISGALSLARRGVDGVAVLTDTDVVVLEDPRGVSFPATAVASKLVDNPNPPLRVLKDLFASAGLALPPLHPLDWHPESSTVAGNGNGGLYLVPGGLLSQVAGAWEHWARWLLDQAEIPNNWGRFIDQMAMAMALAAEGVDTFALDTRWNFPTHQLDAVPAEVAVPLVLHYHKNVNQMGLLTRTGVATIDGQIETANKAISQIWHEAFPNATFWEWRYLTNPTLGSGVGSRGKPLTDKRELLVSLLEILRPASVLDVGCGDGEATKGLPLGSYIGLDLSLEATRRAQLGNPDGDYRVGTLADHPVEADLTLCLDVLIHEADTAAYTDLVERLVQSSTKALLISGYERGPDTHSPMVHFHEPLSTTLTRFAPEAEQYPLRDVHGITTILLLKPPVERHPRDFTPATLAEIAGRHENLLRLISLRTSAWRTTGFFPDHSPRLWEYPAVAEYLTTALKPGSRILDIGAGVNPLVPYLSELGYALETVDPSNRLRGWPPQTDWNEWGFLDYGAAGLAHHSWNCTLDQMPPDATFDGVYCLSVIEHLVADDRRALLREMAARTNPGGVVVLTVDLVRGNNDLWNRVSGRIVEPPKRHGRLKDVVSEAKSAGLETVEQQTIRDWGDVPVDIGFIVMKRGTTPGSKTSLKDRLRGLRR